MAIFHTSHNHEPWNKGKLVGQKAAEAEGHLGN